MNYKRILAGLLGILFAGSIMSSALAEIFHRTLILGPGAGEFTVGDLGIGDTMVLTLVNPTNQPLTFETTQNLGNEKSWTVQPNSSRIVEFTYARPFDDDVEFVVRGPAGPPIATGTMIRLQPAERPAAFQPAQPTGVAAPMAPAVRGFW